MPIEDMEPAHAAWARGYKIVRKEGKGYRSSLCMFGEKSSVTYTALEEAVPKLGAGPLTVFKTLGDAERFFRDFGWRNYGDAVPCIYREHADQKAGLWRVNRQSEGFRTLPSGTVLADVVICLE